MEQLGLAGWTPSGRAFSGLHPNCHSLPDSSNISLPNNMEHVTGKWKQQEQQGHLSHSSGMRSVRLRTTSYTLPEVQCRAVALFPYTLTVEMERRSPPNPPFSSSSPYSSSEESKERGAMPQSSLFRDPGCLQFSRGTLSGFSPSGSRGERARGAESTPTTFSCNKNKMKIKVFNLAARPRAKVQAQKQNRAKNLSLLP